MGPWGTGAGSGRQGRDRETTGVTAASPAHAGAMIMIQVFARAPAYTESVSKVSGQTPDHPARHGSQIGHGGDGGEAGRAAGGEHRGERSGCRREDDVAGDDGNRDGRAAVAVHVDE